MQQMQSKCKLNACKCNAWRLAGWAKHVGQDKAWRWQRDVWTGLAAPGRAKLALASEGPGARPGAGLFVRDDGCPGKGKGKPGPWPGRAAWAGPPKASKGLGKGRRRRPGWPEGTTLALTLGRVNNKEILAVKQG